MPESRRAPPAPGRCPRSAPRHVGVELRVALDVQLVDDRVLQRGLGRTSPCQSNSRRTRPSAARTAPSRRGLAAERRAPLHARPRSRGRRGRAAACRGCSVCRRWGPRGRGRGIRSAARPGAGDPAAPHVSLVELERPAPLGAGLVEQAQLHGLGDARTEHREFVAVAIDMRAERGRVTRGVLAPAREPDHHVGDQSGPARLVRGAQAAPSSPWKYSWNTSRVAASPVGLLKRSPEHRRLPVAVARKMSTSRCERSLVIWCSVRCCPDPRGNSTVNPSPRRAANRSSAPITR